MNTTEQLTKQLAAFMFLTPHDCNPSISDARLPSILPLEEQLEEGGLDVLGRYYPDENKVEVDHQKCRELASLWNIPQGAIEKIVLIHELAHFVSHTGIGAHPGRRWERFKFEPSFEGIFDKTGAVLTGRDPRKSEKFREHTRVREGIAQGFTYLWIWQNDSASLLKAFERLSRSSPSDYQQWPTLPKKFDEAWNYMVWWLNKASERITEADLRFERKDADTINDI